VNVDHFFYKIVCVSISSRVENLLQCVGNSTAVIKADSTVQTLLSPAR